MTIQDKMKHIQDLQKSGKIIITRQGLFGTDFETIDKSFSFRSKRRGGGFMQGTNVYEITIEDKVNLTADFNKAINLTYEYLKNEKI